MINVKVRDDGLVDFILDVPVNAPGMKVDKFALKEILNHVNVTLKDLDIKILSAPALSFRPKGDSFELYRLTCVIPDTIQLRQLKKSWPPRRKKKAGQQEEVKDLNEIQNIKSDVELIVQK